MADEDNANKRTRARQACEPCRKKKTKCSGEYPKCTNCVTHGFDCVYVAIEKRRGPQKGYVRALENRLDSLQNLLEDYVEKISPAVGGGEDMEGDMDGDYGEQIQYYDNDGGNDGFDLIEEIPTDPNSPGQDGHEEASNQQLVLASNPNKRSRPNNSNSELVPTRARDNTKYPRPVESYIKGPSSSSRSLKPSRAPVKLPEKAGHLTLMENGNSRYLGESSGVYLMRQNSDNRYELLQVPDVGLNRVPGPTINLNFNLTKQQTDLLVAVYFTQIHPYFPIIPQDHFLEEYKKSITQIPSYLLDAICALSSGMLVTKKQNIITDVLGLGESCYARARQQLLLLIDTESVSAIQSYLLLSLCFHLSAGNKSWVNSGLAIRQAFALGLHRDSDIGDNSPALILDQNTRRRAWWGCYITDRVISVHLGRPLTIDEDEYDTPFPDFILESGEDLPNCSGVELNPVPSLELRNRYFCKYIEICQISGKVTKNIYSVRSRQGYSALKLQSNIHHLDDTLQGWYQSLIQEWPQLNSTDSSPSNESYPFSISLKLLYHTINILLFRPLLPKPTKMISTFARPYFDKCEASARAIVHLLSNNSDIYLSLFSISNIYPLLVSFSIHVLGASSNSSEDLSKEKFKQYAIDTLCTLSKLKYKTFFSSKALLGCIDVVCSLDIIPLGHIDETWPDILKQVLKTYYGLRSNNQTFMETPSNPLPQHNPIQQYQASTITTSLTTHSVSNTSQTVSRPMNPTQFLQSRVLGQIKKQDPKPDPTSSVSPNTQPQPFADNKQFNPNMAQRAPVQTWQGDVDSSNNRPNGNSIDSGSNNIPKSNPNTVGAFNPMHNSTSQSPQNVVKEQNYFPPPQMPAFSQQQQQSYSYNAQVSSSIPISATESGINTINTQNIDMSNTTSRDFMANFGMDQNNLNNPMFLNAAAQQQAHQQMLLNSLIQQQNQANSNNLNFNGMGNQQMSLDPNQLLLGNFGNPNLNNLDSMRGVEPFNWDPLYNLNFSGFNPSGPL